MTILVTSLHLWLDVATVDAGDDLFVQLSLTPVLLQALISH